ASLTMVVGRPSVTITAPAGGSIFAYGEPVALTGTARDAADRDLGDAVRWTSSLDGILGTGGTVTMSTLRPGNHTVSASVTDSCGTTSTAAVTLVVGPVIVLDGTYTNDFKPKDLATKTTIDAWGA